MNDLVFISASSPNPTLEDDLNATPQLADDFKPFRRLSFPRDSGCFASNENLHRSSPAASDRSFHSGSQTESGIHLTNDDEVLFNDFFLTSKKIKNNCQFYIFSLRHFAGLFT